MSYVDDNLLPGEQVTFHTRLHPITFVTPIALALLAVLRKRKFKHHLARYRFRQSALSR